MAEIVELRPMGVLHVDGKRMSRLEFARKIAEKLGLPVENIEPARMREFTWKAKRPRDSSLNTSKVSRLLEAPFNDMDLALEIFAKELGKEERGVK